MCTLTVALYCGLPLGSVTVNSTAQGPAAPSITGTSCAGLGVGVGVGGWAKLQKAIARIDPTPGDQTLKTENLLRKRVWLNEINFGDFGNLGLFWQSTAFVHVFPA
jgi:hypothetical protein